MKDAIGTGIYSQDWEIPKIGNSVFQINTTTSVDHMKISIKNKMDRRLIVTDNRIFNLSGSLSYTKEIIICPFL
jgi:hypothetical protein